MSLILLSILRNRALLIFAAAIVLFQVSNAAMLPIMAGSLTMRVPQWATAVLAICILAPVGPITVDPSLPRRRRWAATHGSRTRSGAGRCWRPAGTRCVQHTFGGALRLVWVRCERTSITDARHPSRPDLSSYPTPATSRASCCRGHRSLRRRQARYLGQGGHVVLLGSIARSRYTEALLSNLASGSFSPAEFVGPGDMSRGALMLRSVEARAELTLIPVHGSARGRVGLRKQLA